MLGVPLVGFVGSRAAMTPPSASGGFVETQPLIERLLKPPEAGSMPFRVERNDLISSWPERTDGRADG